MKFINTLAASAAALAIGLVAAPAMATEDTTCAYCSIDGVDITILGRTAFGGVLEGGFDGDGAAGTVSGWKQGGGSTKSSATYEGNGCPGDCSDITIKGEVRAFEEGQIEVEASSSKPGSMLTIANGGELVSGAGLGVIITRFGGWAPEPNDD